LFLAYSCAYSWVALMPVDSHHPSMLMAQIAAAAASVFAIAGVYFTLLDDARLPLELTGSAVGIISVVGFTPDIFMGQISGYWLDTYPGTRGYQYFYLFMAGWLPHDPCLRARRGEMWRPGIALRPGLEPRSTHGFVPRQQQLGLS